MPDATQRSEFVCIICQQPVKLETAKANEQGKVVHEDCYARHITERSSHQASGAD
jgi:hypothetical protein